MNFNTASRQPTRTASRPSAKIVSAQTTKPVAPPSSAAGVNRPMPRQQRPSTISPVNPQPTNKRQSSASPAITGKVQAGAIVGPKKYICPSCGSSTSGCTAIRGFAANSAALNAYHKQQINQLAVTMLQRGKNAVGVTGYASGKSSSPYNKVLAKRRALAVITELRKQLFRLKPGAMKNFLWKVITRPGGRRVEICVRQVRR